MHIRVTEIKDSPILQKAYNLVSKMGINLRRHC